MSDAPRWLPAHLAGEGPLRRPVLKRDWSAPAVLERVEVAVHDTYESLPVLRHRRPPLLARAGSAVGRIAQQAQDRAEAGVFRAGLRLAVWWLTRCLRRR